MTVWIEALLDNQPVSPSDRKRIISPPPPFYKDGVEPPITAADLLPPPTLSTANSSARRRSTRSMSPSKRVQSPRKARLPKATTALKDHPLKCEPLVMNGLYEKSESVATSEDDGAVATTTITTTEETSETVVEEFPTKKEPTVKVEINNVHQTNGDVEVEETRVKVEYPHDEAKFLPIPENTEDVMEKAKAMVEESRRLEGDLPTKKRKAGEFSDDSTDEYSINPPSAKRSRLLEEQLKQEKIKTKALIGLSIGLTLT